MLTYIGGPANGKRLPDVDDQHRIGIPDPSRPGGPIVQYRRERISCGPGRTIDLMIVDGMSVEQAINMMTWFYRPKVDATSTVGQLLLDRLSQWEQRTDHDIGPGLHLMSASVEFLPDGSGYVVATLSTTVPDDTFGERVDLSRLMTKVGAAGMNFKRIGFDRPEDVFAILEQPLSIDWRR